MQQVLAHNPSLAKLRIEAFRQRAEEFAMPRENRKGTARPSSERPFASKPITTCRKLDPIEFDISQRFVKLWNAASPVALG